MTACCRVDQEYRHALRTIVIAADPQSETADPQEGDRLSQPELSNDLQHPRLTCGLCGRKSSLGRRSRFEGIVVCLLRHPQSEAVSANISTSGQLHWALIRGLLKAPPFRFPIALLASLITAFSGAVLAVRIRVPLGFWVLESAAQEGGVSAMRLRRPPRIRALWRFACRVLPSHGPFSRVL
jgi:hypothetical protein